jgi:hypothetical protein
MPDINRTIDLDETLSVLAVPYRRWLLYLLLGREMTTIDEVASELHTIDEAVPGETVTETLITTRLHHTDLPKLVDAGLIEYDHRNGDIVLLEDSEELQDLLETLQQWEAPPSEPSSHKILFH